MTNLQTIFGAATMMALNALMLLAALEPVPTGRAQAAEIAARTVTSTAV